MSCSPSPSQGIDRINNKVDEAREEIEFVLKKDLLLIDASLPNYRIFNSTCSS